MDPIKPYEIENVLGNTFGNKFKVLLILEYINNIILGLFQLKQLRT